MALATAAVVACSSSGGDGGSTNDASLVVGIQSESFGALVESVHVVATLDGAVVSDQTVPAAALPKEVPITGTPGAKLEVVVDALTSQPPLRNDKDLAGYIVTTKRAATVLVDKKLLRMNLETRCLAPSAAGGGGTPGPACDAPLTCASGRCVPEDVPPGALESYDPAWPTSPPDICRPASHGAPDVTLGTGQTDYKTLTDGQVLQLERGPQGGHHIWIATRMKNLRQSGSRTVLTASMPDAPDVVIEPAAYVFTFDPDEGNYCKLWGLRFQLDANAADLSNDYKKFLGKRLTVTVAVTDSTNTTGSSTKTIMISPDLLCPDGSSGTCN